MCRSQLGSHCGAEPDPELGAEPGPELGAEPGSELQPEPDPELDPAPGAGSVPAALRSVWAVPGVQGPRPHPRGGSPRQDEAGQDDHGPTDPRAAVPVVQRRRRDEQSNGGRSEQLRPSPTGTFFILENFFVFRPGIHFSLC